MRVFKVSRILVGMILCIISLIDYFRFRGKSKYYKYSLLYEFYPLMLLINGFNLVDAVKYMLILIGAFLSKRILWGIDFTVNTSNRLQLEELVKEVKQSDKFKKYYNESNRWNKLVVKEKGLNEYSVRICTGVRFRLTYRIRESMANELSSIDNRKSMAFGYLISAASFALISLMGILK